MMSGVSIAWAQSETEPAAPEVAPTPAVEEQQALEADMEAAKKKLQAAAAAQPAATTQPADPTQPGFEEIKATPVGEGGSEAENVLKARMEGTEGMDSGKAWGGTIVFEHAVGTGTFMSDSTMRKTNSYVAQSWDFRPYYVFSLDGIKLKASARLGFEWEYTKPDTNPGRRFKPTDTSLSLGAPQLYKEPLTDISFNASVRWSLPTAYGSWSVKRQYSVLGATVGAQRFFGPLHVSYALGGNRNFNTSKVPYSAGTVCRAGEEGCDVAGGATQNITPPSGIADPSWVPAGMMNTEYMVSNTFGIDYSVTEELSVSYSLALRNGFKYRDDNVNSLDDKTSPNADDGRGRTDQLWPSLSVDYALDGLIKPVLDLPVSLTASLGIVAMHPAKTKDNSSLMWPFFYQAFANNHAADNYGSIIFDIAGTF